MRKMKAVQLSKVSRGRIGLLLLFLFLSNASWGQSGNSCVNSIPVPVNSSVDTFSITSQNAWFSFNSGVSAVSCRVQVTSAPGDPTSPTTLELYSGNCSSPILIANGVQDLSLLLIDAGVSPSTDYLVHVSNSASTNMVFDLFLEVASSSVICPPCTTGNCQLVCNPGMENYVIPPPGPSSNNCCEWINANSPAGAGGTPDFFSDDPGSNWQVSVPSNYQGQQTAHSAGNYKGIYCYYFNPNLPAQSANSREFIQTQLSAPLIPFVQYELSFWVSLADCSNFAIQDLGGYFSSVRPFQTSINDPLTQFTPQVTGTMIYSNAQAWVQITGTFSVTTPGVDWLTIGSFATDGQQTRQTVTPALPSTSNLHPEYGCYYYIDDVTVKPVGSMTVSYQPNPVCLGDNMSFVANSAIAPGTYVWSGFSGPFTCGNADCSNVSYTPSAAGSQTVTVSTFSFLYGCTDDATITFSVLPGPASVSAGPDIQVCAGQLVTLTGSNPGANDIYTWTDQFGNVICSNCSSTTFVATQSQSYTYTVGNSQSGCSRSDVVNVTVFDVPVATIVGYATNNCGVGTIAYTANPCNVPGIQYSWVVSGGSPTSGTGCNVNVNWTTGGGSIMLTAWDQINGCSTSTTLIIPPCCDDLTPGFDIHNMTASQALALYGTAGVINTPSNIYITGVFTVDVPITFLNCGNINVGGNTPIIVNPAQTITFTNCTTTSKCGYMWDGIYIPDPFAAVYINGGSLIQYAKNAVVSNNGGHFEIKDSKLQNNYKDIVVNAYNGVHSGTVTNTDFTMSGPFLTAIPAFPVGHTETVCAIEIRDNANITIGDASQVSYRNHFTDILVGIRSHNSITTIVNASFTNFTPNGAQTGNVVDAGTGIVAVGNKGTVYQPALTVGGLGLNQCFFSDMVIGIDASERIHVNILRNRIFKIRRFGVRVQRSQQTFININANLITNATSPFAFNTGILVLECYQAIVNINTNNIYAPNPIPNQTGIGIRVGLVTPGDIILNVVGNSIDRARTGIWGQNLVGKNHVFITNNDITFRKPNVQYTTVHYGVRLENCATVSVRYNIIQKTGATPTTTTLRDNLRGITLDNSPVSIVAHNDITKMGSGIYGWEDCNNSTLACNNLGMCYDGFFFTGGVSTGFACNIGDQVVNNGNDAPTGNTWSGTFNGDLAGTIQPTIYWYRDVSYSPTHIGFLTSGSLQGNNTTLSPNT